MLTLTVMRKQDVLDYYQTSARVAEALGITPQAISQWGDIIPFFSAFRLHQMTGGRLKLDVRMYGRKNIA